jgi:hypothetical protein
MWSFEDMKIALNIESLQHLGCDVRSNGNMAYAFDRAGTCIAIAVDMKGWFWSKKVCPKYKPTFRVKAISI